MPDDTISKKLFIFDEIFTGELDKIKKQRTERGVETPPLRALPTDEKEAKKEEEKRKKPSAELRDNLVGLCFSGGGIRSATFNLGVLQDLKKLELLKYVDYLSTVSGGGYIGSWFVANRYRWQKRSKDENIAAGVKNPDGFLEGKGSFAIHHLRRYSRYLSPEQGFMSADFWTMIAIWFRNTILIQAMVFCVLGVALLVPWAWALLFGWLSSEQVNTNGWLSIGLPVLAVQGVLAAIAAFFAFKQVWLLANKSDADDGKNQAMGIRSVQCCITLPLMAAAALAAARVWFLVDHFVSGHKEYSPWTDSLTLGVCAFIALVGTCLAGASINCPAPKKQTSTFSTEGMASTVQADGNGKCCGFGILVLIFAVLSVVNVAWVHLSMKVFEAIRGNHNLEMASPSGGMFLAATVGPSMMTLLYGMVLVLVIGLAGRCMKDEVREWYSRVGALLSIYCVGGMFLCAVALFSPVVLEWLGFLRDKWVTGSTLTTLLGTLVASLLSARSAKSSDKEKGGWTALIAVAGPYVVMIGLILGEANFLRWMMRPNGVADPFMSKVDMSRIYMFETHVWMNMGVIAFILVVAGFLLIWRVDLNEFSMNEFYRNRLVRCYLGGARTGNERHAHPLTGFDFSDDIELGDLADLEKSSGPYLLVNTALNTPQGGDLEVQERKAEAFLLSQGFCGFERRHATDGENALEKKPLVADESRPYGAKKLPIEDEQPSQPADDTENLKKKSLIAEESLLFEKNKLAIEEAHLSSATGEKDAFAAQGYRSTHGYIYGEKKQTVSLGTAMSISGAAASPNCGFHTSPVTAFLMTIFNARLGWWVPHPARAKWMEQSPKWYFIYLIKELFGSASRCDDYVYLSDGGHFENSGLYELVRRKCKLIIAGDAEEDGNYGFQALGFAIRRCRIDFGAEIKIDVSQIRNRDAAGHSQAHCAVGTIKYAGGEKGTLVYLKSSLTGDESGDLLQYHLAVPAFPHESTAEQFFSEEQFESYRALGKHITLGVFRNIIGKDASAAGFSLDTIVGSFSKNLREYWSPPASSSVSSFVENTTTLAKIWRQLQADPSLAFMDEEILPKWQEVIDNKDLNDNVPCQNEQATTPPDDTATVDARRKADYLCQQILQLMENVYLDLNLRENAGHPDNKGWLRLFKHWAKGTNIKRVWALSERTYGTRFGQFWDHVLVK